MKCAPSEKTMSIFIAFISNGFTLMTVYEKALCYHVTFVSKKFICLAMLCFTTLCCVCCGSCFVTIPAW